MDSQELANEILRAVTPEQVPEVPHPGVPPEKASERGVYNQKLDAHIKYLLSKPSHALSKNDQNTLGAALGEWAREERL